MKTDDGHESKLDDSAIKTFHASAVHHDDPRFPPAPPDLWFNQRSGEYEKVKKEDRREKYLQGMILCGGRASPGLD